MTLTRSIEEKKEVEKPDSQSANSISPASIFDDIITVTTLLPLESRRYEDFSLGDKFKVSFHEICRVEWQNDKDELRTFYLKLKKYDGSQYAPFLSELEAAAAAFHRFLAPGHTPETYALYNSAGHYEGVASEEIPGFIPESLSHLTEDDLDFKYFEAANKDFNFFEAKDAACKIIENKLENLKRHMKSLEQQEAKLKDELNCMEAQIREAGQETDFKKIDKLQTQFGLILKKKAAWIVAKASAMQELEDFYSPEARGAISRRDLEKYRIVKGLGISLTTGYIFHEDDLHSNNMSKKGERIDFDMLLWPFSYLVNEKGYFNWKFRCPANDALVVHLSDIVNFPELEHHVPYYWPTGKNSTSSIPILSDLVKEGLKKIATNSTNPFSSESNEIYKKLKSHPIFVHFKYHQITRYMLTNAELYKKISLLHIREDRYFQNKPVFEILGHDQGIRIDNFKAVLTQLTDYMKFFVMYGDDILKDLQREINCQNEIYKKRKAMEEKEIIALQEMITPKKINSDIKDKETMDQNVILLEEKKAYLAAYENAMIDPAIIKKQWQEIGVLIEAKLAIYQNEQPVKIMSTPLPTEYCAPVCSPVVEKQSDDYSFVSLQVSTAVSAYNSFLLGGYVSINFFWNRCLGGMKDEIIKKCADLKPKSLNVDDHANSITSLKIFLETKRDELSKSDDHKNGEMHKIINKLLSDKKLWEFAKVSLTVPVRTFVSH